MCVMEFDLTGFERRVPDEDAVASVGIWGIDTKPYDTANYGATVSADPEVIRAVLAAHQAIVENKDAIEAVQSDGIGDWWTEDEAEYSVQTRGYSGFQVVYTLENGKSLSRDYAYNIPIFQKDLNDPESVTAKLDALVNLPQVKEQIYGLSDESGADLVDLTLTVYDFEGDYQTSVAVTRENYARVFEAVLADLEEGNLGRRYLMDDEERMNNCFTNDLKFAFYRPNMGTTPEERSFTATANFTVTLQTTAKHTLTVLGELGVLESPAQLITKAQEEAGRSAWSENGESWAGIDRNDYVWATLGE